MSTTFPIQTNFSGGEISPRLHGNVEASVYARGAEKLINWMVTPQGSIINRPPTEYRALAYQTSNNVALFTFERALDDDVIVELNAGMLRLINQSGQIVPGETENLIRNPNFANGFTNWDVDKFTDLNIFGIPPEFLGDPIPPGGYPMIIRQLLFGGVGQGVIIPQLFGQNYTDGWDAVNQTIDVIPNEVNTFSCRLKCVIRYFLGQQDLKGKVLIEIGTTLGDNDILSNDYEFTEFNQDVDYSFDFTPLVNQVFLRISTENVYNNGGAQAGRDITISQLKLVALITGAPPTEFVSPWPVDKVDEVQTTMDSAKGELFFFQRDTPIHWLYFDQGIWTFEPVPFINFPLEDDGTTPQWSAANGYPGCGTIKDGRLWVGSSTEYPSRIWGSEVWDYLRFELVAATPDPKDPLEFQLSTKGRISWMHDIKNLLIGTNVGEVLGRGTNGGPITIDDFDFPMETFWGSAPVQPARVNNELIFITPDFGMLRSLSDAGDSINGYDSNEISFIGEHLVRQRVRQIEYAKLPMYQVACLLGNGNLAMCTYVKEANVTAWWQMTIGTEVLAITFSNGARGTSLWMVVRRDGELILEELTLADEKITRLDSEVSGMLDETTKIASGFEAFADKTVSVVLINSSDTDTPIYQRHPDVTVASDGTAQLESWAVGTPVMGYTIFSDGKTLKPETSGNPSGTSQTSEISWAFIQARLNKSFPPIINGQRPPSRLASDPMNISPPYLTGDVEVEDLDYGDGKITFQQDVPLRTEIVALFGKADTSDR